MILRTPDDPGPPPRRPEFPAEDRCGCVRAELRVMTQADGRRVAVRQCLDCFRNVGAVKTTATMRATAKPFDRAARDRRLAARAEKTRAWLAGQADRERAYQEAWWAWYGRYLASARWAAKRAAVLARDRGRCVVPGCGRAAVQVHHLTYERVGDEAMDDLAAVCETCHSAAHLLRRRAV